MITFKLPKSTTDNSVTIEVPGSKSYTNRALVIGALTKGNVVISNALVSDDTIAMVSCLNELGIETLDINGGFLVRGDVSRVTRKKITLDAKLSGTTLRFLLALCTVVPADVTLTGIGSLLKRPIKDMVDSLKSAGADITYLGESGYPPVRIRSSKLKTNNLTVSGSTSSQFISALLMISPALPGITLNIIDGLVSLPYVDMTIDIMSQFGVTSQNDGYKKITIPAGEAYASKTYEVEGDMSSASYFLAFAALSERQMTVENVNPDSKQADMEIVRILEKLGTIIKKHKGAIEAQGNGVIPLDIDMERCPDQAMTMATLLAFAKGDSRISGIGSLRIKETERVKATQQELKKMGISTASTEDDLTIFSGNAHAAAISTYDDHRIAMSFALASAKLENMQIRNPEVVTKTFPGFWHFLYQLGSRRFSDQSNIVLIGMRGSGKTTAGTLLQHETGRDFIDSDQTILIESGKAANDIISADGIDVFRKIESDVIRRIADKNQCIIATGGGVILNERNMAPLKKSGVIVWLRADSNTLEGRLHQSSSRVPLTTHKKMIDEIRQLQTERDSLYRQYADVIIDTDTLTAEQTMASILKSMELLQ